MLWRAREGFGEIGDIVPLDLVDGQWTTSIAAGNRPARITMNDCIVEDHAVLVEPETIPLADDAVLTFRLRAIPELRLRVVDAATRKELEGLDVLRTQTWRRSLHPGRPAPDRGMPLHAVARGERSPVVVTPSAVRRADETHLYWVRAPGYAWQSLDVLAMQGGEREVALVPGGTLTVRVTGPLPKAPAGVYLRILPQGRDARSREVEFALADGLPGTVEGLPAGRYDVRLELGESFRDPRLLARGAATVEPGKEESLELQIRAELEKPPATTVRGVLALPPEWLADDGTVGLSVEPLARAQHWVRYEHLRGDQLPRGEREGEFRFALPGLVPGSYVATVTPGHHQKVFTVGEDAEELRIEVPPPVDVVVRVVDGATRAPRNGLRLHWHPQRPLGVSGGSLQSASAGADSNAVRFRAPAGKVVVSASGDDFEVADRVLTVGPDAKEFEVATRPVFGVKVELYEGTTRLPVGWESGWNISLEPLTGRSLSHSWRGDGVPVVKKPGRYVLRVVAPDGWDPVPDRQVTLSEGPFPTIEIKVKRKP